MNTINLITNYNGDPESIDVESILKYFNENYSNINTRAKVLSQTKRKLMERTPIQGYDNGYEYNVYQRKNRLPSDLLGKLNKLVLDRSDSNNLRDIRKKNHENKITNDFVITKDIVEKLIGLINSKDIVDVAIGLAVCTGRRSTEITKTGTFKGIRGVKTDVRFSGILKNHLNKTVIFNIPVIGKPIRIVKACKNIRKEWVTTDMTNEQTEKMYGSRIRRGLYKIFQEYNLDNQHCNFHTLRSIYIEYLYKYCNPNNLSKTHMIKTYLLHEDTSTTSNYNNVKITED
jgi:hypothetical protein